MDIKVIDERSVLGKDFKVYGTTENPLFLAKDVAEWIDYSYKDSRKTARDTSKMLKTIDEEEKLVGTLFLSGQNREAWFLTEDGLYEVLMQSRKPIAKEFKKEVKKILKQIRLTGGAVRNEEEFIKNYFPSFSEEVKQAMVLDLRKQNEKIQKELEEKNK
ncbi:BRO-N domain-containing protein, partial [Clostridium perfringens]